MSQAAGVSCTKPGHCPVLSQQSLKLCYTAGAWDKADLIPSAHADTDAIQSSYSAGIYPIKQVIDYYNPVFRYA